MDILYISSMHHELEHDELVVLTELGHSWFSTGHYVDPSIPHPGDALRGPITAPSRPDLIAKFKLLNQQHRINGPIYLTKEFVDPFDLVIAEHCCPLPNELFRLWDCIKHKPIIWRTYGQQNGHGLEERVSALKRTKPITLVRVAKTESNIPNFAGLDFVIKGYIDETLYQGWNGFGGEILTFNNMYATRRWHSNTNIYELVRQALSSHPFSLYGKLNEGVALCKGVLPMEKQVEAYQKCGVYFALGSKPAALTYNFQEALMTGCPVVTFGRLLGSSAPNMADIYEVPDLVEHGVEAFLGDTVGDLIFYIKTMLTQEKYAREVSVAARAKAIKLFSKAENKKLWNDAINFTVGK